ncbi:hypothetical protein OBBRIDRAFT_788519 [Obba rivulosa]|uniref:Uncharacterized protein n=1 Tax=Obba rivulosa TaxID=1052685 RepID=A0A8E2DT50_9APHY|nr:hypothetical protein OBBRIDRAFT_788519 [Obba rivulosa]
MYCGRVTAQLMERRWRKDAVLESPFTKCDGFTTIASHWHALSKLCSSSECLNTRILSATLSPNRLIYSQTQRYTLRFFGIKKTITSIVVVDLDEDFRIIQLVDQWNGQELPTRWGALWLRKLSARVTPWIFPAPMHKNE